MTDAPTGFGEWERLAWEARADAYAASFGDLTRGSVPALLDAVGAAPGVRLLDVGTGPGFVALAAGELGADVRAVDQSASMVRIADAAGVDAVASPADALPFHDAEFDAVVASYLLNHVPDPVATVREFARVLAPGGTLAMTIWDVAAHNEAIGLIGEVVQRCGLVAEVPPGPDPYRFTDETAAQELLAGWADVRIIRPTWTITVDPGRWFDAIAESTPRTGAALAQAAPAERATARERYVALVSSTRAAGPDTVALTAAAVLITGRRPPSRTSA